MQQAKAPNSEVTSVRFRGDIYGELSQIYMIFDVT